LLAQIQVKRNPSASDLGSLLVKALQEPLVDVSHRPRHIQIGSYGKWKELIPQFRELGIEVSVKRQLPKVTEVYQEYLRKWQEASRAKMVRPTAEQQRVEKLFPAFARYVQGCGHIEIGEQEMFGFIARALDYGGMVFEDNRPGTLAEAMAVLEDGLRKWFEKEGVEVHQR
jgi:hypothetical protein